MKTLLLFCERARLSDLLVFEDAGGNFVLLHQRGTLVISAHAAVQPDFH